MEIKPFKIGNIDINLPVVLAPLAGFSDLPYRRLCRKFGAPYCTTEMILDRCVSTAGKQQRAILASDEKDHPTAGQIVGNDPQEMANAAVELCNRGFDIVDLNFACPVNKALKRKRGGMLMSDSGLANEIISAVVEASSKPVTLKVRQKFDDADTEEEFWNMAEHAKNAGCVAITVHGRSVEQKYTGTADWDFIRRVKETFSDWTVIGSGDVLTAEAAIAMLEQTGVDAAAVARGVIGNPWIFSQVKNLMEGKPAGKPSLTLQRETLKQHYTDVCEFYGDFKGPKCMRKFGIKYSKMHPEPKKVRMAFVECKTPADLDAVMDHFYCDNYPNQ